MNKNVILKEDVVSIAKKGKYYAKAGDRLKIITDDHAPVLIVADLKGNRFPVHQDKLIS